MTPRFSLSRMILPVLLVLFSTGSVRAADTLCPDIDTLKKDTPGDVAGVQADIERLNLCVQRATLLKQLDDLAKQRGEILYKAANPGAEGGGLGGGMGSNMGGLGVNIIPSLPVSALPALPAEKPLKPGEVRIKQPGGNLMAGEAGISQSVTKSAPATDNWQIRKIWGQAGGVAGASMWAQLSNSKGGLLNVVKGDPLPDGQVVESVSVKGVTLSGTGPKGSGKMNDLSWEDSPASSSASTP